jgi:hypothetical protein
MQAAAALALHPSFVYLAMFDEVNEGTAYFKAATSKAQTPSDGSFLWLGYDGGPALPNDYYLNLAQNLTSSFHALHGQ